MIWIACALFPLVGGLHRFAVSYGYEGKNREEAWAGAWRVTLMLAAFSFLFAITAGCAASTVHVTLARWRF